MADPHSVAAPAGLVSVVFSFRNERETIPELVRRLHTVFEAGNVEYELIFVNDASTDGSLETLLAERQRNPRVKIINMSRRFGVAEFARAGLAAATGDAVVYMDADLQDPPEVIPRLLEKWRGGAAIVHTVRTHRHGESPLKMWLTRLAYRLIQSGSSIQLPIDAGDFKLLSRPAVNHLLGLRETDPYIRGLVVWLGFTQAFVPYERDARHAGRTHFPFFSRNPWKTFFMGLTSFSFMPIYLLGIVAIVGLAAAVLLAVVGLMASYADPFVPTFYAMFTFYWATTLAAVAAVGLYIVRIYKDVRGRPQYIVESTMGFPSGATPTRDQ